VTGDRPDEPEGAGCGCGAAFFLAGLALVAVLALPNDVLGVIAKLAVVVGVAIVVLWAASEDD